MTKESNDQLHRLVKYLIKNHIMGLDEIAKVLGIPLKQFIAEFEEDYNNRS